MATITVRALNPITWDPIQGSGQANFLADLDAMVQILATRLKLYTGEWFLDLLDGLPMFDGILGSGGGETNIQTIINIITARCTSTIYVTGINYVTATYNSSSRTLKWSASVQTKFGPVFVTNTPNSAVLATN